MKRGLLAGTVALVLIPAALLATDHFIIVGGGPKPSSSEAQIEYNVKWVIAALREIVPQSVVSVWFGEGATSERGAVELLSRHAEPQPPLDALASLYGEADANRLTYRPHRVEDVLGTTERDSLIPALQRYLRALRPGDQAMIVYNGHGGWDRDRAENTLRLWDETTLNVRDFERLLAQVSPAVPVRFILTQCYAGSFARAVSPDAALTLDLAKGQRCGFLAESADRQSEGCSASIDLGDYRDYTTYFFSGLTGKDRLGRPVAGATDRDGDGRVSPYDAHLYTLLEGYNGDLPRSTSEDWLERWQPWESRWVGTGRLPENIYGVLAREMARRAGLPEDGAALGAALAAAYRSLTRANTAALRASDSLEQAAEETRERIREPIERRWPELGAPHTAGYRELLARGTDAVEDAIRADPRFAELLRLQDARAALEPGLVDLDRRISQLDKVRRTRMLARALDQLERRGKAVHQEAYRRLRVCEALPLHGN